MWNDTQCYLALHGPFIMTMAWLVLSELSVPGVKLAGMLFFLIHVVTVIAYLLHLGDDFAMGTYLMMFAAVPGAVLYFKMLRLPRNEQRPAIYLPLAVALVPLLGIAGLILAFMNTPMDWR